MVYSHIYQSQSIALNSGSSRKDSPKLLAKFAEIIQYGL